MREPDGSLKHGVDLAARALLKFSQEYGAFLEAGLDSIPGEDFPARFGYLHSEESCLDRYARLYAKRLQVCLSALELRREQLARKHLARLRRANPQGDLKSLVRGLDDLVTRKAVKRLCRTLREAAILEALRQGSLSWSTSLSREAKYGQGMDERVVEIPLACEVAAFDRPGKLLDAGSALNLAYIHDFVGTPACHVVHFTQSSTKEYFGPVGDRFSYVYGDLRSLDFRDGTFDRVVCLSTLEHVGMDNTRYSGPSEGAPETFLEAFREMLRVLAPGGSMVVTVPYGEPMSLGWYQVFGLRAVKDMLRAAGDAHVITKYYYRRGLYWEEGKHRPPKQKNREGEAIPGLFALNMRKTE